MTPKQQRFVDEYLVDLNASAAARRAGYKGDANTVGPRLLANVGIRSQIEKAMKAREERTHITQDRVLQELARVAFSDLRKLYRPDGSMLLPHEWDDDTAAAMAGVETVEQQTVEIDDGEIKRAPTFTKKAKVFDKGAALTLAMRHLGMLTDKVQHSGPAGGPVTFVIEGVEPGKQ